LSPVGHVSKWVGNLTPCLRGQCLWCAFYGPY